MSGILGFYSEDNLTQHNAVLDNMQAAVSHRGLDGLGAWIEAEVAIGHQRFVTTPEAKYERSPHINHAGYVITADVRLDNREELIEILSIQDSNIPQLTDPDLILQAYQKWGQDCPEKLLGAFAFVIWDPDKQIFFGARDHMGIKPLYYSQRENFFAFASEIKALLRSPQISQELDEKRITDLLTSDLNDNIRTCYTAITRLPAAHWIEFSPHYPIKIQKYWQLNPHQEILLKNDAEYIQAFQRIFDRAVQCRLRHAAPIGTHLSGGMDSSSITVTAEHLLAESNPNETLQTFSATFKSIPECDESDYIQDILTQGQFKPRFVAADTIGPLSHWTELFQALDEPALGNGYLTWLMNQAAQKQGIRILLNGYDGDTTVGHGTLYPHELAQSGQWKAALQEANLLAQRFAVDGITPLSLMRRISYEVLTELRQDKKWCQILNAIPQICSPLQLSPFHLAHIFFLRPVIRHVLGKRTLGNPDQMPHQKQFSILHPRLRKSLQQTRTEQNHPCHTKQQPKTVRLDQWETLSSGIMTFPMELLDQISAPFHIEPRFPLMDKRLVEFCLALPPNQKLRQGWTRFILRNSMTGRLPTHIQWRETKTDLTQAFDEGVMKYNREILHEIFEDSPERVQSWIDLPAMHALVAAGLSSQSIKELWPVITLSLWKKQKGIGNQAHGFEKIESLS